MKRGITILDASVRSGLLSLIVLPAFAFGSFHPVSYTFFVILSFALMAACGWRWTLALASNEGISHFHARRGLIVVVPLLAMCLFVALQLLPLPPGLLRSLSPAAAELYQSFASGADVDKTAGWQPISICPATTLTSLLKLLGCGCVFIAAACGIAKRRDARRLLCGIAVTAAVLALFAIVQELTNNGKVYWVWRPKYLYRHVGPYLNAFDFAAYMSIALPLAFSMVCARIGGRSQEDSQFGLIFWITVSMVIGAALAVAASRAAVVAAVVACGLVFVLLRPAGFRSRQWALWGAMFLGALVVFCTASGVLLARMQELPHATQRLGIWRDTLSMVRDFPIVGAGFGCFVEIFPKYQCESAGMLFGHPGNEVLEILAETGVVGMVIAGVFGGAWLWMLLLWSGIRRHVLDGNDALLAGLAGAFLAFVLICMLHSAFRIPANGILLFAMMGVAVRYGAAPLSAGDTNWIEGTEHRR